MARRTPSAWVRDASDELALREGCYFDEPAGRYVCDFLERFCRLSEGRWAGEPLKLIPWQRDLCTRQYGWKRPDGRRRFNSVYTEVGKKNGKSPFESGKVLYHLTGDGEGGPKIYLNACDREQARIVFEHSANMVRQSPDLGSHLDVIDSRNRIVCPENFGVIIANSATVDAKDGRNASYVSFDELHRQPNRLLWNVFQGAGASRLNFLLSSITTAGDSEEGVWHEQREYSEAVASGEIPDTTHLGAVYRALPTDDFDDPAVWRKANPSLGYTITEEQFKRDLDKAKLFPLDWHDFLRKRFNVVATASEKYFDVQRWDALAGPVTADALRGLAACMGLDLSKTNDLTALVVLASVDGRRYRLLSRFWCPEALLDDLGRRTRQPYRYWAEKGFLTPTPGNAVDYAFVRREVRELALRLNLVKGLADPWNAQKTVSELIEEDGLPFEFLQQGFKSLSDPTKQFKRLVDAALVEHDGNPVMRWCIRNAVGVEDDQKNVKLSKKLSRENIDGAAAGVNAMAGFGPGSDEPADSVYNTRGILTL